MKILISPIDWGLGLATRLIPILKNYQIMGRHHYAGDVKALN
jgi:hypothetical protein